MLFRSFCFCDILQEQPSSFGLDAKKVYQPDKYHLYLIINSFGKTIVEKNQQEKYFKKIFVTNDFSQSNILSLINSCLTKNNNFTVITNSEETMPLCGKVRVALGIDSQDYSRFYDKHVMKTKLHSNYSLSLPKYKIIDLNKYLSHGNSYLDQLTETMAFPLFVKPVQMYSSVNLKKITDRNMLYEWAKQTNPSDYFEIDEFIEGTMYHCDSYIQEGKVLFSFVSENSRPCYNFTVGQMKGTIVLPQDNPDHIRIAHAAEQALITIGMPQAGVTHLEVIKTKEQKLYFIEVAHRSPGCLIPKMYEVHSGIDTITSHFLLQIDPDFYPIPQCGTYAAWACYPKSPGIVTELNNLPYHINCQYEIDWRVKIGDKITSYSKFGRDYTGTIFMKHENFDALYNEFQLINDINLCVISPEYQLVE